MKFPEFVALSKCLLLILPTYFHLCDSATRADVLQYLNSISGSKIISGQHNREPNSDPVKWTRVVKEITGLYPGLWGGDFLFNADDVRNRQTMIDEAKRQGNAGSVVTLMWHVCPPTQGETCDWANGIQSKLTDVQWRSLVTDGSTMNRRYKQRLDTIVPFLQQLKDAGVVVIWRPLHEMNGNWFWWGGRPGANGSQKLFQITHDYLSSRFDNLIWGWCVSDQGEMNALANYWPGANYVDVAGMDGYKTKQPSDEDYQRMLSVAGGKPIALSEVGSVPTPVTLERQNRWVWFMVWADYLRNPEWNTDEGVKETYYLSKTLRQGELEI